MTSGGQREHRYDRLRAQMATPASRRTSRRATSSRTILDMFRYGCPPHGGFGIGVNRLLMSLLAQPSIREASFVFRGRAIRPLMEESWHGRARTV